MYSLTRIPQTSEVKNMKLKQGLGYWYLSLLVILLAFSSMMVGCTQIPPKPRGAIVSATPSTATPKIGENIQVNVNISLSGVAAPDNTLGNYTASLDWDPTVLEYISYSEAPPTGFTGVVNTADAATGHIIFNGTSASGAAGDISVISVNFNVVGAGTSSLDLELTAMSAAKTFKDLMPLLKVNDSKVKVSAPSGAIILRW
jgi:hypothetical protein